MRTYYNLAVRGEHTVFALEFGDYDRAVVVSEMQDMRGHGMKAKHMRIVRSKDTQASIDQAISELNQSY